MVWVGISYQVRFNLLRIEGNLDSNKYVREMLQPEIIPILQAFLELSFSQKIHAHILQILSETSVQPNSHNVFLGMLIRRICRLLSTCELWLVSFLLLICFLQFQKTNFNYEYKQYGIIFPKQTFKICLTPCHVV